MEQYCHGTIATATVSNIANH